jgi:hypothetical protein
LLDPGLGNLNLDLHFFYEVSFEVFTAFGAASR